MAKKAKKSEKKQERADESGFMGGCPVNFGKKLKSGETLREKLEKDLSDWVGEAIDAQSDRIEKIRKWEKSYKGKREPKSWPWPEAANCAVPVTRTLTDAVVVRIFDTIWGQKKLWIVKNKTSEFAEVAEDLENGLEWWQKDITKLKNKLYSPMLQCIKTGTGIIKMDYSRKKRTQYRYAKPDELEDKSVKKYPAKNGQKLVKETITSYDGPDVYPISREDWIISPEAKTIDEAFLVGFKRPYRKNELDAKARKEIFDKDVVEAMTAPDDIDETKKERAENQDIEIKDYLRKNWNIYEVWFRCDVDEDGEEDDICVWWHHESASVLGGVYNPSFYGFRPFVELIFNPVEFRFDGEGTVEILTPLQEEIDTVHNQRLDRMTLINSPPRLVRDGAVVEDEDLENLAPGKTITVDDIESAITELLSSDVYPSTFTEEAILEKYAEKAVGVTPHVLGQPTAERPVARETLALIQEANKKFKFGIDNIRDCIGEVGFKALELFAQYRSSYTYYMDGKEGLTATTFEFPLDFIRDGVTVELRSSSEMLNQEIRREIHLTVWQLMSDFYTKLAGMMQGVLSPMVPMKFKLWLMEVMKVSGEVIMRILKDFDIVDPETLVTTPDEMIEPQDLMQRPPMVPPQGGPPGGPPGGPSPMTGMRM